MFQIIAHLATIPSPANVVIRTSDTDVLVIALANNENIRRGVQTYLEVGLSSNNPLRFINVTKLAVKLGPLLCKALTGLHCFTGCDHAPEFSRKGKIGPLAIKKKNKFTKKLSLLLGAVNKSVMQSFQILKCLSVKCMELKTKQDS